MLGTTLGAISQRVKIVFHLYLLSKRAVVALRDKLVVKSREAAALTLQNTNRIHGLLLVPLHVRATAFRTPRHHDYLPNSLKRRPTSRDATTPTTRRMKYRHIT